MAEDSAARSSPELRRPLREQPQALEPWRGPRPQASQKPRTAAHSTDPRGNSSTSCDNRREAVGAPEQRPEALLGNAARHSQANLVKVNLDLGEDRIRVSVDDNGKGFDPDSVQQSNSLGLKLIRERAEMLGGTFEIDSALGRGTRILFAVPARS